MNHIGQKHFDYCRMSTDYSRFLNSGPYPTMDKADISQENMTSENWSHMSNQEQLQSYATHFTDCERQSQSINSGNNCSSPDSLRTENGPVFYTNGSDSSRDGLEPNAYQGLLYQQMIPNTNFISNQQFQNGNFQPCITSNTNNFLPTSVALTEVSLPDMNYLDVNLTRSTVFPSPTTGITVEQSGPPFSTNAFHNQNVTTTNSNSLSTSLTEGWHGRPLVKVPNEQDGRHAIFSPENSCPARSTVTNDCSGEQQNYQESTKIGNPNASFAFHGEYVNRMSPMKIHADLFNQSSSQDGNLEQSPRSIETSSLCDSSTIVSSLDELAKAMAENSETARLIESALGSQKDFHCEHPPFQSFNADSSDFSCRTTNDLSPLSSNVSNLSNFDAGNEHKFFEDPLQTKFVTGSAVVGQLPRTTVSSSVSKSVKCGMAHKSVSLDNESEKNNCFPEAIHSCYSSTESPLSVHAKNHNQAFHPESNSYVDGPSNQNFDLNVRVQVPKNDLYFKASPQFHEEPYYSHPLDITDLSSSSCEDNSFFFVKSKKAIPYTQPHYPVNKLCENLNSSMRESTTQLSVNKEDHPGTGVNFDDFSSLQGNATHRRRKRPKPSSSDGCNAREMNQDCSESIPPNFKAQNNRAPNTWETLNDTMTRDVRHQRENEITSAEPDSVIHKKMRSDNGQPKALMKSRSIVKICGVCGDRAKSMHFGGMACDSCKAFFRRSVQGKCWKEFQCLAEKQCTISKKNRKNCQYCRFAKCRSNGMDVSWVMTEAERITLWKSRLEKHKKEKKRFRKNKVDLQNDLHFPDSVETCSESSADDPDDASRDETSKSAGTDDYQTTGESSNESSFYRQSSDVETCSVGSKGTIESLDVTNSSITEKIFSNTIEGTTVTTFSKDHPLSKTDTTIMNNLIALLTSVFTNNPFPASCSGDTFEALTTIFFSVSQKMGSFFQRVDDFQSVPRSDQIYLLRMGVSTSIYFFGAYNFDGDTMSWPRKSGLKVLKVPPVSGQTVMQLAQSSETYNTLIKFYELLWRDLQDEGIFALMSLLCLFQVRENYEEVKDRLGVMARREKYIQLLSRYLRFRQGERGSDVTLPKLLSGLNEVWRIAENHSKIDIQSCMLTPNEVLAAESSKSHSDLMESLLTLVENLAVQPFPAHSSVLVKPSTLSTEASAVEQEHRSSNFHHPVTNAIFGNESPGRLLTCPAELILKGPENYQKFECGRSSTVLNPKEKTSTLQQSVDDERTLKKPPTVAGNRQSVSNTFSSEESSSSESCMKEQEATSLTQEGIGVVCEVLEYISQSNDPEAIKSLKKCLPPSVLKALASKLNDDDGSS